MRSNPTEEQILGFPLGQSTVQQLGVALGQGVWWRGQPGMGPAEGDRALERSRGCVSSRPQQEDSHNFCLHGCRNE